MYFARRFIRVGEDLVVSAHAHVLRDERFCTYAMTRRYVYVVCTHVSHILVFTHVLILLLRQSLQILFSRKDMDVS